MIEILIADDHAMFREGLRHLLEADHRMRVVGEAGTCSEALSKARDASPDVVLLDIGMPGRGVLEGVKELKHQQPKVRVLVLTARREDHYAIRCLRAGADGYLTKNKAGDELVDAILKVHQGGKFISLDLAEQLAVSIGDPDDHLPHEKLSDREFQVLRMIAEGRSVSEIAVELCLSVKTVSTYRGRILEKTGLRNNAEIIRYALRYNLAD